MTVSKAFSVKTAALAATWCFAIGSAVAGYSCATSLQNGSDGSK